MGRSLTELAEEQGHAAAADGKRVIDGCLDHLPVPCSQRDRPLQEKTELVTRWPPQQGVSTSIEDKPRQASSSPDFPSTCDQGDGALSTTLAPNRAACPTMAARLEPGCCRKRDEHPATTHTVYLAVATG